MATKLKKNDHPNFKATIRPLPERVAILTLPKGVPIWPEDRSLYKQYRMQPLNNIGVLKSFYNGYKILKYLLWTHSKTVRALKQPAKTQREKQTQIQMGADFVAQAFEDAGIKVNYYGQTAKELGHKKVLYASNHISWLDGFVHFVRTKAPVVAMQGVEKTPLIGKAFSNVALMPVKRNQDMGDATPEDKKMANRIAVYNQSKELVHDPDGNGLLLFPEGTMSPGKEIIVKPTRTIFRTLFTQDDNGEITGPEDEAAVQPVAMIIRRVQGQDVKAGDPLCDQFAYYGDGAPNQGLHMLKNIIPTSFRGGIELDVYYLPPISAKQACGDGFDTPAKLTDAVMLQIQNVIQNPPHLPPKLPQVHRTPF
ncbi:MAG: 1-acyl-sn-glycerol-3-phosphate acyltransferase [Alphaproteobacteria bacterium]|nr:1-acyl-sn-glycerol-3-phosphate acyltransferase [Alphaproteobacteria bacterium]